MARLIEAGSKVTGGCYFVREASIFFLGDRVFQLILNFK
jgi:hypothetical protein